MAAKRKASTAFVPDSMTSYLAGALRTNFESLTRHIDRDPALQAAKLASPTFVKALLEELFRYLYLLADDSLDGVVRSSPSFLVKKAHCCIMLDPVLYFQVCDEILSLQGRNDIEVRVLPNDPHEGFVNDAAVRVTRLSNTRIRYTQTFGQDPPLPMWCDYHNDAVPAALQRASPTTVYSVVLSALFEYAIRAAVSNKELSSYEGDQAMSCWQEAKQQEGKKEKHAMCVRLLEEKFGPVKGRTIHELLMARKSRAAHMLQPDMLSLRDANNAIDLTRDSGPAGEGRRIRIRCVDPFGEVVALKVLPYTSMHFVMQAVATHKNFSISALRFMFDGLRIQSRHTVESLQLEKGSKIDVFIGTCADL